MIEKLSHIKNPLSVIAIFAGLAEVSGTVVLPLLEKDIQHIYVWFLMGFPCLLVGLFFLTLWTNYVVLYAPSDFSNEQIFADLLVKGSPAAKYEKLQGEIRSDDVGASEVAQVLPSDDALSNSTSPESAGIERKKEDFVVCPQADDDDEQGPLAIVRLPIRKDGAFEAAVVAEELAINRLSQVLEVSIHRDVSMKGIPNAVYDGISFDRNGTIVIEVRYTRTGLYARDNILHSFNRVKMLWDRLPISSRANFSFKFVIVHASGASVDKIIKMQEAVTSSAVMFPFKTDVIVFDYDMLKHDVQSAIDK